MISTSARNAVPCSELSYTLGEGSGQRLEVPICLKQCKTLSPIPRYILYRPKKVGVATVKPFHHRQPKLRVSKRCCRLCRFIRLCMGTNIEFAKSL